MDRRVFLGTVAFLAAPPAATAQQPGKVYRVGVLTNKASDPAEARLWQAFRPGLRERGDFAGAFSAMTKEGVGGVVVITSSMFYAERTRIAKLAARSRVPAIYGVKEFVEAGGLMTYGINLHESFRRAATYVDKILKGARPADLPVEQPNKFELVINLKTAKALGLTSPPSLLQRADQVIE